MRLARRSLPAYARFALAAAAGALVLACADQGDRSPGPNTPSPSFSSAQSQDALARVMAIQNRNTARLMRIPSVVGTGTGLADNGQPEIVVFPRSEGVSSSPVGIEGVKTEVRLIGAIQATTPETERPGR